MNNIENMFFNLKNKIKTGDFNIDKNEIKEILNLLKELKILKKEKLNKKKGQFLKIKQNIKKINLNKELEYLLNEAENLKFKIETDNCTPICDTYGICEVDNPNEDDIVGNCYYCGTELRKWKNDWYHHSAFDDEGNLIDENYQTHNYYGINDNEPYYIEQRELNEIETKIIDINLKLGKLNEK